VHEECYGGYHLSETEVFVIKCKILGLFLGYYLSCYQAGSATFALAIVQTNQELRQMSSKLDQIIYMFHNRKKYHFLCYTAEAEPATLSKTSKAQKRRQKDAHEQQVRERELARVSESGSQPESAEDFERLVMGEPNSSMLWIQYMAFLISLGEIEKARGVAERGLATINYRSVHAHLES